ncbi:MAG: 3-oxoacyl-[acyl-carrier-protein] synthase III C-terminal domain-containing protein, partial [Salinivirgaceae bacterium]|nr:3-oxoacyl-[acyl-carrier-protein] synthase III C-terminal domain-containing protein [Salinivirgaceae bacterium]
SPAMTLTSGCAGFNKGIQRAIDHFKANPEVNNVMLAHTETMSHFLNENNNFVAHATFADAAAAIIISRKTALNSEGVINQVNYHDIKMIDSVGVDKNWNLYMDGGQVKKRAVINITNVSKEILEKTDWSLDDLDLVVPHQTGNAILHTVAQELSLPMEKLYQEAQHKYGNISGATIPLALSMLKHSGKLQEGMKILCPTAGVGGEYGAFSYIVPKASKKIKSENLPLKGKTALVLFSDSKLGVELCDKMLQLGCTVVAHSNQTNEWSMHLFQRQQSYPGLILNVETLNSAENANKWLEDNFANQSFDYQINLFSAKESIYGILDNNDVIQWSSLNQHLSRKLLSKTKSTCIILGHPSEFVTSLTTNPLSELFLGWQGLMGSMAGEAISKGVTTIWYTPGIYEKMTAYMDSNMKNACKSHLNQKYSGLITEIVDRIIKSLYLLKVKDTKDTHLGPLKHRVEQFAFRTACEGNK